MRNAVTQKMKENPRPTAETWRNWLNGHVNEFLSTYLADEAEHLGEGSPGLDALLDTMGEMHRHRVLGRGTDWLEAVLADALMANIEFLEFAVFALLGGMKGENSHLYAGPVNRVLERVHHCALDNPLEKWVPYCRVVGMLAQDEFKTRGEGDAAPVLAILIDAFHRTPRYRDRDGDGKARPVIEEGAAACVAQLDEAVVRAMVLLPRSTGGFARTAPNGVALSDWRRWAKWFVVIRDDELRPRSLRLMASDAAKRMESIGTGET